MARIIFQVLKNIANNKNSEEKLKISWKFLENEPVFFPDRTNVFSDEKQGYPGFCLSTKFIVYDDALFNFDGYF